MSVLKTITDYRMLIVLILSLPVAAHAEDILYGKDIKNQASRFFKEIGITGEIMTSDRRAFFSCEEELEFSPHVQNDWRTVRVKCYSPNWQSILRTNALAPNENIENKEDLISSSKVVSIVNNLSKGQVIEKENLVLVSMPKQNVFEGFTKIEDLIGR